MKILNLTEAVQQKITEHRAAVAEAANVIIKGNRQLNEATSRHEACSAEIATLESSANASDRKSIQALGEKRLELDLLRRDIEALPKVDVEAEDRVRNLLRQAAQIVAAALFPMQEAFVAEVAKAVRPFHQDDAWAAHTARQTPAVAALMSRTRPNFSLGNVVMEAQRVQRISDEILSGELNWSFDPKLS